MTLELFSLFDFLYIKEGSVCWYGGLSCKLNSNVLSKVRVLFFLRYKKCSGVFA